MTEEIGKTDDYTDLMECSRNYRYLFNSSTKCFLARKADVCLVFIQFARILSGNSGFGTICVGYIPSFEKIRATGLKEHDILPVVRLNGKKLDTPFIEVKQLLQGGELTFQPE